MTAMEVIVARGVPASVIQGKSQKEINALARALDSSFKAPREVNVEVCQYTTKGKGAIGTYLKVDAGGRQGIFEKLNEGPAITPEGKALAVVLLEGLANAAADALETL